MFASSEAQETLCHAVNCRSEPAHNKWESERQRALWRTRSATSCGEPCVLLLFVLFIQICLSHLSTHMQRVAVNLAWRKHGFKLKEGSDVATPPVRASSSTSQTKRHKTNMEITHMTWCALKENRHLENISVLAMKCGEVILKDT